MYSKSFALVFVFLTLRGPSCTNSDHLELLMSTLKTMQRAACDDETVSLSCPNGTSINIQKARYTKSTSAPCVADVTSSDGTDEVCELTNALQYMLLQTVVEKCQKKPSCAFDTKLNRPQVDPCSASKKFVEVEYKCRPTEFRSVIGCENDVLELSCNLDFKIAIFKAEFGRAAYEAFNCPQSQSLEYKPCEASHGTETVMKVCHGRQHCSVPADSRVFGTPCEPNIRPYLKVTYACVPQGVLARRYELRAGEIEMSNSNEIGRNNIHETDSQSSIDGRRSGGDQNQSPPVDDRPLQSTKDGGTSRTDTNSEPSTNSTLYLYIGIGLAVIIVIAASAVAIRCYMVRRSSKNSKTDDMFNVEAPNVFSDSTSDIDNDIDVSHISGTFYDPMHPDMILYRDIPGNRGTLRAMKPLSTIYPTASSAYGNDTVPHVRKITTDVFRKSVEHDADPDTLVSPRSLRGYSNSQFFYG